MGLFDKFKKKFENVGLQKKVKHVVEEKKSDKKKSAKAKDGSLTAEEIQAAQAMEGGAKAENKEKDVKAKKSDTKRETGPRDTKLAYKVLLKPLITEKASSMGSTGKYVFEVYPNASKGEVRKAVKAAYGIEPIAINIVSVQGKDVRYGMQRGRTKNRKKAIITLPQGKTIDVYQS